MRLFWLGTQTLRFCSDSEDVTKVGNKIKHLLMNSDVTFQAEGTVNITGFVSPWKPSRVQQEIQTGLGGRWFPLNPKSETTSEMLKAKSPSVGPSGLDKDVKFSSFHTRALLSLFYFMT
uniref:Uncharacterized protein n=1 Tax=Nothobranchius kadleci TaxID=1051664 RepID=A0A1A8CG41_NOTKA